MWCFAVKSCSCVAWVFPFVQLWQQVQQCIAYMGICTSLGWQQQQQQKQRQQ
jgi:hypothetical protein